MENFKMIEEYDFDLKPYDHDCSEGIKLLNEYLKKINKIFAKGQNGFAELCFYVYKVRELFKNYTLTYFNRFVTKKNEYVFFDNITQGLGLSDKDVSRLCGCYEKFVEQETDKPVMLEEFFGFSKSKLFELLTVDTEQLKVDIKNNVLRPDMSVLSIREYVKNYKAQQKQKKKLFEDEEEDIKETINEEDIPPAYNPKQHYDFSYFEEKTKAQLLNIVWQLQTEYEKLKKKVK